MNIPELQQLDNIQREIFCRLGSDPFFADVPIILVQPGLIAADVLQGLGTLNEKTGKMGVCVLVELPNFDSDNSNSPGLQGKMLASFRVLEQKQYNADPDTGTGKTASMIALRGARVMQLYIGKSICNTMTVDKNALRAYSADLKSGLVGFDVLLQVPGGLTGGDKVKPLIISGSAAAVTITCGTAGATIYYTLDGSYPGSGNVDDSGALLATLYTVPFAVSPGTTVRAGAETNALVPSDTTAHLY